MTEFATQHLPARRDAVAPDQSDVRVLLQLTRVAHRTVEEIWFFLSGRGEMWRGQNAREEVVAVQAGVCLTIPLGTHFQFSLPRRRAAGCRRRHDAAVAG